ncbi:GNAT family N-acetyltransferase (plasmid) [Pseudoalteromonas sp. T1lg65]|uniref:GNAT family N-acetyltransferase n=1 Tax=Pseudoalteromonas sp. T1lg65 TaxID=2077101 RepID=UPI003F79142D
MITTDNKVILPYLNSIHHLLTETYWAKGMPKPLLEKAITNSLCFLMLNQENQVQAFCRVITDKATFAYLADVIVPAQARGKGLGRELIQAVMSHEDLQGLRRFMLATLDAHGLYEKFGFTQVANPDIIMEINHPNMYQSKASALA